MDSLENLELIRSIILYTGWPILITGSVYLTIVSFKFYRNVGKNVIGKLVIAMVLGWFVSMYSLGITATVFMLTHVQVGVPVVLPIFFIWFITMIIISWAVLKWSKETINLSAFYRKLEDVVKEKTKELKKEYSRRLRQESELRKLRERFVFIAAHELRTPITAIDWGLKTIIQDEKFRKTIPEDYLKLLEDLYKKNKNLIDLVSDYLNVARLQSDTLNFELSDVSLTKIFKDLADNIKFPIAESGIKIIWPGLDQNIPAVKAHEGYVKEVLQNLIMNAIRYNKPGGFVKAEIKVRPEEIIIQIADSGIGMTKNDMKDLFQEFYRIKSEETQGIEGTGLGLFISKQLIDKMGGKIWVESSKEEGSTFSFSLKRSG